MSDHEVALREYGYRRARNPEDARRQMIEEQDGLKRLIGQEFRDEFAFALSMLETMPFRFAKSMPRNPHEYTLRKEWPVEHDFFRVVRLIRSNGEIRQFGAWPYIVLPATDYFYWTMGWPVPMTTVINRKPIAEL